MGSIIMMFRLSESIIKKVFNVPVTKFKTQLRYISPNNNDSWIATCIDRAPLASVDPLYASNYWYNNTTGRYEIRFNPSRVVHQYRCADSSSYIYELIISRHDYPRQNNLITFIVYSNPLVDQYVIQAFKKSIYLNQCVVINNPDFNERIGVGQTVSQNNLDAQKQINELIAIINKLNPKLPCSIQENILDFINPQINDNQLSNKYPKQKKTIYEYPRTIGKPVKTFCESDNDILPTTLPDIFTYILNEDYIKLKLLLEDQPKLANLRDPFGRYAHDVACHISSNEIFKLFFNARERLGYVNERESIIQDHYTRYFNKQYSVVGLFRDDEYTRLQYKEGYLCRLSRMETKDLDSAASANQVITATTSLDMPRDKKMMLTLKYQSEQDFSDRFTQAIKQDDVAIVKAMLYYLKQLPDKDNATFLEFIWRKHTTLSTEMYNIFLYYYQKTYNLPLPTGMLNNDIKQEICDMIKKYNLQIEDVRNKKLRSPILQHPIKYQSQSLIETFISSDHEFNILSIQKPIELLTKKEKEEMYQLFFYNFSIISDNSTINKQKYFNAAISSLNHQDSFDLVNLFYDQKTGKLVSFLTTRIISSYHQSVGEFILFHSKFAGNNPQYSSLNLTNLGMRNFLAEAISQSNKPVYMFIKSIPPGYALCLLPFHIDFSPKKPIPQSLLEHIVSLADDDLTGEVIPCKLKVNSERKPTFANLPLTFYRDIVGDGEKNAMPIVIPGNQECIEQYFELLKYNGISLDTFNDYIQKYNQMKQDRLTANLHYTI